jgi:hypothetical protein
MLITCKLFTSYDRVGNKSRGANGELQPRLSGLPPRRPRSTSCIERHAPLVEGSNPHSHLHRSHSFARSASGSETGWEMNARSLILSAAVSCKDGDNCNGEGVPLCSRTASRRDAHGGVACAYGKRCWRPRRVSNATNSSGSDMVLSSLVHTHSGLTNDCNWRPHCRTEPSRAERSELRMRDSLAR